MTTTASSAEKKPKPKVEPNLRKENRADSCRKPKVISQKVQKIEPKAIQQDDTQEKLKNSKI
jgi:protein TonB